MNLGLDPNDPRYQKMLRDMIRSGKIDPATMESQVAQAANAPMTSGDMSGYVDEAQAEQKKKAFAERSADFSGQERKIKNQRDYADSLRGRAAPQGRNVGPLNVYHGPNWGESLAHATGEVMGGYMAGKANRADEGLDKARTAQKAAEIAAAQADKDTALELKERELADRAASRAEALDWRKEEAEIRKGDKAENLRRWDIREQQRLDDLGLTEEKDIKKEEQRINTEGRRLTEKINSEGITGARTKLDRFFRTIAPYEVTDGEGNRTGKYDNIPGLGGLNNSQIVGGAVTFAEDKIDDLKRAAGFGDTEGESGDGATIRAAYTDVLNQKVKDISGGAVPVAEWIRNQAAAGYSIWNDDMNAVDGMREIQKALDSKESNIIGGYEDAVADKYRAKAEEKTVVRTGTDTDTNERVTIYSDGSEERTPL